MRRLTEKGNELYLTIQIAVGIWFGGLFLFGTVAAFFTLRERIQRNRRYGYHWWQNLFEP